MPAAVLLVRPPEDYYDEGEVVIDPRHLGRVYVHENSYRRPRRTTMKLTTSTMKTITLPAGKTDHTF